MADTEGDDKKEVKSDVDGESDPPYNLYDPLSPETVIERIRYRRQESRQNNYGRGTDIHGSPIRLSSVAIGVDVSKACLCVEWTLIGVLICVVWLLLMIPTAFYIKTYVVSSGTNSSNNSHSTKNCTPVEYTGDICRLSLLSCQTLTSNENRDGSNSNNATVYISSIVDQQLWEDIALKLNQVKFILTEACRKEIIPFFCLYYFKLCDKESNELLQPSKEYCVNLLEDLCHDIVEMVPSKFLPKCEELPPKTESLDTCISNQSQNSSKTDPLDCQDDFYYDDDPSLQQCFPECNRWSPLSDTTIKVTDGLILGVVIFAIITSAAVLVLGCLRCNRVFVFPTILIIYQTFSVLVLAVVVLIGYTSRTNLFCSSRNLLSTLFNPTPFCIFSGIILYYVLMQLLILWLFQVTFVFWGTWWPMNARRFLLSGKGHCLHIILIHLGLLLPIIPVVAVGVTKGFTHTRLPPVMCASPHVNANFFSMILPISIIIAIGGSLLILIMRSVIKKHVIAKIRGQRPQFLWWSSEIKVLIVLTYYVILGVVVLTTFTIAMTNLGNFQSETLRYFQCESHRNATANSTSCDRGAVERLVNPIPTTVAFLLIGIYPAVNLVYTWNYRELKEKWRSRQVEYVNRSNSVWFSREALRATIRHKHSFSQAPK